MEFKGLIRENLSDCKIHFYSDAGDDQRGINLLLAGEFEEDQRYQSQRNFQKQYIISLIGLENKTSYLFAGMFKVTGINENKPGQPFYGDCKWVYDTEELTEYEHLVGRLIVRPKRIIGRSVYRLAENIADDLEIVEYSPQAFNSSKVKGLSSIEEMHNEFNDELKKAFELESATLVEKSKSYPNKPASINTIVSVFKRNPYVTAIVLKNANGVCGNCNRTAPFKRKKDGSPYLEVHHRKTLANGGDDTVENCIALCPNCHREMHYG